MPFHVDGPSLRGRLPPTALLLLVISCSSDGGGTQTGGSGGVNGRAGSGASDTGGTATTTGGSAGTSSTGGSGGAHVSSGGTGAGGVAPGIGGASGSGGDSSGDPDAGDGSVPEPAHELLYVAGAPASGNGSVIIVYDVDTSTWTLTKRVSLNTQGLASFLAFAGDRLYATDESQGMLRSFRLDRSTGAPTTLNAVQTSGHPTHVAVDPAGRFVFAADYNEGKVEVVGVDSTGALTTGVDSESPGALAHEVVFSPDGKFVFVPCKGSDKVAQFRYTASTGALDANTPPSVASASGAGPRHMAFGPDGHFAYVIDELGNTMETLSYDAAAGVFTRKSALTTLPAGFSGSSTAAEVAVSPSGRFVYGSNRITGANGDLVIYAVGADGMLTLVGHEGTRGQTPRHFSLDPSGRALVVANLDSSQVVVFRIDDSTGKLTFATQTDVGVKPQYAGFPGPN